MDKAVVFGIYNFVSFHACKALLNKGIEVTGIHIEENEQKLFLEEKRLEIGRNANFSEQTLSEWENCRKDDSSKTVLFFSLYDFYMINKDSFHQQVNVLELIKSYHEQNKTETNLVFILPIQMVNSGLGKEIEVFTSQVSNIQLFYLPAIYGPWQSSSFLFHQAIVSKFQRTKINRGEREWTGDLLFIEDAITAILDVIKTKNNGIFLLESGKQNYWFDCAAYLNINESLLPPNRHESLPLDHHIERVRVKEVTPIAESIAKQIEQIQRLYSN